MTDIEQGEQGEQGRPGDVIILKDGRRLHRVDRYAWTRIIRRLKVNPAWKLVALMATSYGDKDGRDNRPGVALLADICNLDDRTVKVALKGLRDLGLFYRAFEGSSAGRAGGKADVHALTVPPGLAGLPLLPEDERDPEREAKREAAREADRRRKAKGTRRVASTTTRTPPARPAAQEQVICDPEEVICDPGTGDLSSRIPVSQITPPRERPREDPEKGGHHSAPIPARGNAGPMTNDDDSYRAFAERRRSSMIAAGVIEAGEPDPDDEQFFESVIRRDYVAHVVGHMEPREVATVEGMLSGNAHPKAVVNKILKDRGEGEQAYREAQMFLVQLADAPTYMEAARHHLATHFPDAGERSVSILAARLARRDLTRLRAGMVPAGEARLRVVGS